MNEEINQLDSNYIKEFQEKIFLFYRENKRDLPWRRTKDPYKILISEFMLQQTQVSRVIEFYNNWIDNWPTIKDLARSPFNLILSVWIGLGYNRRAKYLHETSKIISNEYNGNVLYAMNFFKNLPGIGTYTSRAVRIFAGNEDIVTIDTNIRRIYIHEFNLEDTISEKALLDIAFQCLPKSKSCRWHNALMDYGALNLTSHKTGIRSRTQQSRFDGSDRQIRGKILRVLLKKSYDFKKLQMKLHIDSERLERILKKMQDENIISMDEKCFRITSH